MIRHNDETYLKFSRASNQDRLDAISYLSQMLLIKEDQKKLALFILEYCNLDKDSIFEIQNKAIDQINQLSIDCVKEELVKLFGEEY